MDEDVNKLVMECYLRSEPSRSVCQISGEIILVYLNVVSKGLPTK